MPPRSYIITAVALAALVAISFPATMGFSILLWYVLFAAAGCILAVAGAFKVATGLGAPLWSGVALVSPGFAWAGNRLVEMVSNNLTIWVWATVPFRFALLAAAAGALRLVETTSGSRTVFRVGYGLLTVLALLFAIGLIPNVTILPNTALYATAVAAMLIECVAFIGAAVMITIRRDIEPWSGVTISLISAYLLYQATLPYLGIFPTDDTMFWLQPVVMLVGGAAVWRMGSVVRAQAISARSAQS